MDGRRRPAPERRSTSSALETGAGAGAMGSGFMEVTFGGGGLAAGGGGGGSGARGFICLEAGFVAVNGIFIESGPQETTHASPGGTTSGLDGMVGSGEVYEGVWRGAGEGCEKVAAMRIASLAWPLASRALRVLFAFHLHTHYTLHTH